MGIFHKRVAFKPFEYPELIEYKSAINHSYWLVSEWTFASDVDDFHSRMSEVEKSAVKNALLAISQVEVAVKKFWGRLGDHFPKPEFEQVGATFAECFIDGTEILTPAGWVDLADIEVGDNVLQYHPNNTFTITKVKNKVDQQYEGPMHRFSKRSAGVVVTPNHRMVHYNDKGEYQVITADKLSVKNSCLKIPEAGKLVGSGEEVLSFVDRLRIAIQADGNRRYYKSASGRKARMGSGAGAEYEIRIQKERKVQRLDWILQNLPEVLVSKRPIPSRPGMFCYTVRLDIDYDYKEFGWVDLFGKTSEWCEDFIQELAEWDGHRLPDKKDCKVKYSTTNKSAADAAQMVGVAAGYRTNIGTHADKRKDSYKDVYTVSFTSNRDRVTLPPLKSEVIDYSGYVRCVTVESGAIITRHNGKTFISGNSEVRHSDAYSHLLQVLGLNQDFEQILTVPAIRGRVNYLADATKAGETDRDFALTLSLFSLFVENVSLFGQFAVVKAVNKHKNYLKDTDNVIQATAQEEQVHALFGAHAVNLIRKEHPKWFDEEFYERVRKSCLKAYRYEAAIVDWIYEQGELPYLTGDELKEFLKFRFNESLVMIGGKPVFSIDEKLLLATRWFTEELLTETKTDFFHKRPVQYSKFQTPITAEDLF